MKKIEAIISPFVENQFPSFYKEEGPQFIAFAKAYFEWMEDSTQEMILEDPTGFEVGDTISQTLDDGVLVTGTILSKVGSTIRVSHDGAEYFRCIGRCRVIAVLTDNTTGAQTFISEATQGGVLHQARNLANYRDIDTTTDRFVVNFKEKYLKNIQFDTATNKKLLVKNSLDLYRSKGTERSIDLFFKLVYGTAAEVRYPADNILRVSDGIWERPEYLEVTHNRFNVDYVGKQIIGALSGSKAFVEKFIRRRTSAGYVDLLYISGRQGEFNNGEVLGLNVNNTPEFDRTKRAKLIGSIKRVVIQDSGRDFRVGDIVTFEGTTNGQGGIARVESVSEATGIVDFIFIDGGYGYTLDSESIISEKVITLDAVIANTNSGQYFKLFEQAVEPIVNASFTSATANLEIGDTLYRYASNGTIVGAGNIIALDQNGDNGTVTISHVNGAFTNTETYYTTANVTSFYANTVEDRTIGGKVMGIPEQYTISLTDQIGTLAVGESILYKNTSAVVGSGIIDSIVSSGTSNTIVITSARGTFPIGQRIEVSSNSAISANVTKVDMTVGVYEIRKYVNTLKYATANNNELSFSNRIFRYDLNNKKIAEGLVLTVSHDSGTLTGNLTFVPIKGYFTETDKFYVDSNTAEATVVTNTILNAGGDYIASEYSRIFTQTSNTVATPLTTSFGSGAQFNAGTLGETEDIFIGTDIISSNNVGSFDYDRVNLTVTSSTGFVAGDRAYQTINKIAFDSNTSVNATSGFITLPTANSKFTIGDIIKYEVDTGNTALNGLANNDFYHVAFSNTTGLILSYPYRKTDFINTSNYPAFANNKISEAGHFLYKLVHGTVFEDAVGIIRTKDNHYNFSNTGGIADVTTYANSTIVKYGATTNTAITAITPYTTLALANQAYAALPITVSAYGFPKNPQGDAKDTIFSCLTFNKFTIGTIGSLVGVDPGSGYNVDPYVLEYQPYISAFNRKDFVLNIDNATGVFVVGEKVNQTLANLVYYDLNVDNGVYSDTFDEKLVTVNVDDEINSSNDFILYSSNVVTFNTSDSVNSNTDFINIANANFYYPGNSYVRYFTNTGNTALTGLSNNAFYYVAVANSTGVTLSLTGGGANINITQASNVVTFNSNTSVDSATDFISIATANTLLANGDQVRYVTATGNTVLTGLTNNSLYYVRFANSTGLALSETPSGANVNITALDPGDSGHILRYYNADYIGHNLVKYANEFADDQRIIYRTPTANTVIDGLANNTAYYIVSANTIGFKLSDTRGGAIKSINAASSSGELHAFSTLPGFLPGDRLYVNSSPISNVTVQSLYTIGANSYLRVSGNTAPLTANVIFSYSNPYVSANILDIDLFQITSTAKGIVKSANTSVVKLKRITFENTFKEGTLLLGDASAASANVVSVSEDPDVLYPIGLNAVIEANVITANGQINSLQVVDSGIGYSNGDVLQYTSADGSRSGSAKVIIDGHGIGQGYYKSSKGFLSEDMYVHDGDYYQEYSYEILSKISVDRYADMFKKVMHTAGTKFFGSALIVEEDSLPVELSEISTGQEIQFNSTTDVSSINETIDTDVDPNPFANGDIVRYTTDTANTVVEGLSNNTLYYVVGTSGTTVKLSITANGTPINITANTTDSGANTSGHYLTKTIEE